MRDPVHGWSLAAVHRLAGGPRFSIDSVLWRAAPSWLVSAAAHLAALFVLAALTIAPPRTTTDLTVVSRNSTACGESR